MQNLFNAIGVCVLDGAENVDVFFNANGYEQLVNQWLFDKYIRSDALKLLSYLMVDCPPRHSIHLIEKTRFLPVIFGILTT